jgi:hypothetical protein
MPFPRLLIVRQKFPDRRIPDVPGEVRRQLAASAFAGRLKPGARVAIGVGSRGIHNIAAIVRAAVDYWKEAGMQPFPPWEATAPHPPPGRPTSSRTTASPKRPWAARW